MDELELAHMTEMQVIEKMALALCSVEEIADYLDITVDELKEYLEKEPYASVYKKARAQARFGLRKNQLSLSRENASMAKFMGINVLDQKDGRDDGSTSQHHHFHEHVHTLEQRREKLLEQFESLAEEEEPKQLEKDEDSRVIEGDFSAKARSSRNQ